MSRPQGPEDEGLTSRTLTPQQFVLPHDPDQVMHVVVIAPATLIQLGGQPLDPAFETVVATPAELD